MSFEKSELEILKDINDKLTMIEKDVHGGSKKEYRWKDAYQGKTRRNS